MWCWTRSSARPRLRTTASRSRVRSRSRTSSRTRARSSSARSPRRRTTSQSKEISGKEDIARVASISSREREIGDVIAEAIDKVGKDGVVNVEEGQTFGLDLEFTEGMQFDKGYLSPYFVTDQERMEAILDEPFILIANQKIGNVQDLLPVLNQIMQQGNRPLLIVAEELGLKLENTQLSQLGRARKVVITKDNTTIIDGDGDAERIRGRINQIRGEIETTDSDFDREKLQERLAKLAGGVAVIKVGAATETELKERKHRVEDA